MPHKFPGEDAYAGPGRLPLARVNLHPFHAAAGGAALENKAAKIFLLQLPQAFLGPGQQAFGVVSLGSDGDQTGTARSRHQVHGLPGNPQAALHFRADWDKFHQLSQGLGNETIQLVPAIIADFLPQKAGTDSQFYFREQSERVKLKIFFNIGCYVEF